MKIPYALFLFALLFVSCHKDDNGACNIKKVYAENSKKVTITTGVWGTTSSVEGDCMPTVPECKSCCQNCPVKRTVQIYEYTTLKDAVTSAQRGDFFDNFNTQLIAQIDTDENGFFQAEIPAGHYTIVILENGKLYAPVSDGQGGLSPVNFNAGTKNINLVMTYKATF